MGRTRVYSGFTLIELSLVLVIIGLIVGGVLVGRDLIAAAAVRAQISQIEKYNQAVNTFKAKYGYLPGDIPDPDASKFGFMVRGTSRGQGDGNGVIEGCPNWTPNASGLGVNGGETAAFWVDLSTALLIDGGFKTANVSYGNTNPVSSTGIGLYMPAAKLGNSNYVYVWSGGVNASFSSGWNNSDNINYFGIANVYYIDNALGEPYSKPGFIVAQAYALDTKIDDGLPTSGKVIAAMDDASSANWKITWSNNAATGSPTTCFDSSSGKWFYSITQNNGAGLACALSIKFQ